MCYFASNFASKVEKHGMYYFANNFASKVEKHGILQKKNLISGFFVEFRERKSNLF